MIPRETERRRIQRINPPDPMLGRIGARRVAVLDLSLTGVRIAHEEPIGRVTQRCTIDLEWDGDRLQLDCEIRRTQIQPAASGSAKPIYHSGLRIVEALNDSGAVLRRFVEAQVLRALDEQKANARGIPPVAPRVSIRRATGFVRHELVGGRWKEVTTSDPSQPEIGFTISQDHSAHEVAMLRAAWERSATAGTRDLIRRLAQLSIGSEPIPVRQYAP